MRRLETLGVGQRIERVVESPFERRRQRDVADPCRSDPQIEVTVVLGEVLGELVPSMVGRCTNRRTTPTCSMTAKLR